MTTFAQQPSAMNSTVFQYPQYPQYPQHRQTFSSGPFTPPSATTPPSTNSSPTSVFSNAPARQLRQPKQCGYIPAALRPTDMAAPKSKRPPTPPRSAHGSLDQGVARDAFLKPNSLPTTPDEDIGSLIAPFGSVSRVVTDEWNDELGQVTGIPTRNHWKPDSSASCCTSPTCTTVFSFLSRRHHCRRCGDIFCTSHSSRHVPLDQEARFHPDGIHERACGNCWNDFTIWSRARKSRANSIASGETTTTATPTFMSGQDPFAMGVDCPNGQNRNKVHPLIAGQESVREGDWNWSTF